MQPAPAPVPSGCLELLGDFDILNALLFEISFAFEIRFKMFVHLRSVCVRVFAL